MSQRAKAIADRIEAMRDEVITFVKRLSDDELKKTCEAEDWAVVVTARHLGAGHFAMSKMLGMVIDSQELPQLTMDQINASSEKDARQHSNCTRGDALEALSKNGAELAAYVAGLTDAELDRKGSMPAFGGQVTTEQFIEYVIFQSAAQHLQSMRHAVTT